MDRLLLSSLAVILASGSSSAFAAEAALEAAADAADQSDIVITGQRPEYGVSTTSTATKTNTDIKRIPQALTVISEKQIEDQQLRSIGDLLLFVPGASYNSGEGNRDTLVLRGNSSTADFFVDGIRDDVQYFRDFYNVDRVEVLKGPNAMIFGRGGGGGIINRVMKRSSLNAYRSVLGSVDSYGGFRVSGDFDQPVANGVGVRLNAMYEDADSFRRHVDLKRYGINPTVGIQVGPDTRIDLSYEHFHDRRTADRGVPSLNGEPVEGFDKTFFGDPDKSFAHANVDVGTFAIEHQLGGGLTLRNRTLFGDYDKFYQNIYAGSTVIPADDDGPARVRLSAYNNRNDRRNLISQTDLIWENRLGGIEQTLLFGFEVGRQKSRNRRLTGTVSDPDLINGNEVPLTDPTANVDVTFAAAGSDANNRVRATVAAAYVQDQIRLSPMFEIVAGLRFDSFRLKVDDLRPQVNRQFSRRDRLWSPRLGLIFKPVDNLSFYTNYSRSYLPQSGDQFGGLDINTVTLKPERFDNYEIGAKWEPVAGLLATAAIYQLDRSNTRVANPDGSGTFLLSGQQRSRGLELGLERSVTSRWLVSAGYTWQKAEVRKATTACPSGNCEVPLVPHHTFSLWNRYDFTRELGAGLGIIARSKSFTSISNNVKLPGYARVDAALYYKLPHGIDAQVNVENIFGADYFPTANGDNNIAPGAPRTVKATLGYRF
jgi:catecholate siderophore receptor